VNVIVALQIEFGFTSEKGSLEDFENWDLLKKFSKKIDH
jgi:hypothetical protein